MAVKMKLEERNRPSLGLSSGIQKLLYLHSSAGEKVHEIRGR